MRVARGVEVTAARARARARVTEAGFELVDASDIDAAAGVRITDTEFTGTASNLRTMDVAVRTRALELRARDSILGLRSSDFACQSNRLGAGKNGLCPMIALDVVKIRLTGSDTVGQTSTDIGLVFMACPNAALKALWALGVCLVAARHRTF